MTNKRWNLEKLERQADGNQSFDEKVLLETGILNEKNLRVLDVGCSNGYKTNKLFGKYEQIDLIVGIDVDEHAINEANKTYKDCNKYQFYVKDIFEMEEEEPFDIIYLSYTLQHLDNPVAVLIQLRKQLSNRGTIIIKVPDDSLKHCYPDPNSVLDRILQLYENEILKKSDITKYTDRNIGKKTLGYLKVSNYSDIKLFYDIIDTVSKDKNQRLKLFESSISFRSQTIKNNISASVKLEMEKLMHEMKTMFEDENFYYGMSVLYYTAKK